MAKRWEGSEPKCSPLNMKTTAALRAKLEEAARASGRCLTEEVLYRVERSFLTDDVARVTRETIRQEMRAEFEARREAEEPVVTMTPEQRAQRQADYEFFKGATWR